MTSYSHRHPGAGISTADLRDGGADKGSSVDDTPRIVWAGSAQCQTLASVLGGGTAVRADADLATACIRARAALLVTRHLTSFDLCNTAVPHGFSPTATSSVVAAVAVGLTPS